MYEIYFTECIALFHFDFLFFNISPRLSLLIFTMVGCSGSCRALPSVRVNTLIR